ncbi:ATP-grasp domain-containing protein [Streptomyces sp. NBC_00057]|uniref:ATP-grasp domain-containing protein n=1 Tax=Streptomyces sp. NBC_00057 TaxID=2975634 RepID=UPI003862E0D2
MQEVKGVADVPRAARAPPRLHARPAWIEPARRIAESFDLHHLTNIQFRFMRDEPVLLNVNTRPADGLHQLARCRLNAPWAAGPHPLRPVPLRPCNSLSTRSPATAADQLPGAARRVLP